MLFRMEFKSHSSADFLFGTASFPSNMKWTQKTFYSAIIIFTNPSARKGYDTRSFFKRSLTGLNSVFSFSYTSCLTIAEEPSVPYYFPVAGGRIIGFIPFPRVLVLCEMQPVSSRIWTHVTVSISHDDNHYIAIIDSLVFTKNNVSTASIWCAWFPAMTVTDHHWKRC